MEPGKCSFVVRRVNGREQVEFVCYTEQKRIAEAAEDVEVDEPTVEHCSSSEVDDYVMYGGDNNTTIEHDASDDDTTIDDASNDHVLIDLNMLPSEQTQPGLFWLLNHCK